MPVMRRHLLHVAAALRLPEIAARLAGDRVAIVTYHGVTAEPHPRGLLASLRTTTRAFAAQMRYLNAHWRVAPLAATIDAVARGERVPPRTVCVTFDDGYENNYSQAFPILQCLRVPATIFLSAGAIGSRELLWHDRLERLVRCTPAAALEFVGERLPLTNDSARATAMSHLSEALKKLPNTSLLEALATFERDYDLQAQTDDADTRILDWEQVRAMQQGGLVEFGAHSMTHAILTRVSATELERELHDARDRIESETGCPCRLLCYPNGQLADFSPEVIRAARAAGYVAGLTTLRGFLRPTTDRFAIPRLSVSGLRPEPAELAFVLSGARDRLRRSMRDDQHMADTRDTADGTANA